MAVLLLQEAEGIIQKIKQQQYVDLLSHDQLLMERRDQKVFLHFGKSGRPRLRGLSGQHCLPFSQNTLGWGGGRSTPGEEGNSGQVRNMRRESRNPGFARFQRKKKSHLRPPTVLKD